MKRFLTFVLAFCLLAPVALTAGAQNSKNTEKALKKQLKERLKQYKKDGWEIVGTRTMEVALSKHFDRQEALGDDYCEVAPGMSLPVRSKNTGIQMATTNAMMQFAKECGSQIQQRLIGNSGAALDEDVMAEVDNFRSAYEQLVEQKLRGELELAYTLMRQTDDGLYEVQAIYYTTNSKVRRMQQGCAEAALDKSTLNSDFKKAVTSFVNE